ncbi:MAG TPA: HEAT repeat domain-containing protein [Candidatus Brocadiia bacterium]|nr:HEAT repeat domain-containing protein [Candidatus Brocadiia bacterium]
MKDVFLRYAGVILILSITASCATTERGEAPVKESVAEKKVEQTVVAEAPQPPAPPKKKESEEELRQRMERESKIAGFMRSLRSRDKGTRRQAAGALLAIGDQAVIETLLRTMQEDTDPEVRITLIEAFGSVQDSHAFQPLLTLLGDRDQALRIAASESLANFKTPAHVNQVLQFVSMPSEPREKRLLLIHTLEYGRIYAGMDALIDLLADPETDIRDAARIALTKITYQTLESDVNAWRKWWDINRVKSREDLLEDHVATLEGKIKDIQKRVDAKQAEIDRLLSLRIDRGEGAQRKFSEILSSEYSSVREYAASELAKLTNEDMKLVAGSDPALMDKLSSPKSEENPGVRLNYCKALSRLESPQAVSSLREYLKDQSGPVLASTALALGQMKDKASIPALGQLIDNDDVKVRRAAAEGLGLMEDPGALKYLVKAARDSSEDVRWFAADGLRRTNSQQAIEPLTILLGDASPRVREGAASALAAFSAAKSVEGLIGALEDTDERVRTKAEKSLSSMVMPDVETLRKVAQVLDSRKATKDLIELLTRELERFRRTEVEDKTLADLRRMLAGAYEAERDLKSSIAVLEEVLRDNPQDEATKQKLASTWVKLESNDKLAESVSRWIHSPDPDVRRFWFVYGLDQMEKWLEKGQTESADKLAAPLREEEPQISDPVLSNRFKELAMRLDEQKKAKNPRAGETTPVPAPGTQLPKNKGEADLRGGDNIYR